ncbi:MAG: cystathionine beta-lyase [Magnetovibrio sp.]|nr:cystathionine beta-lyase [Magnetovibrio sp.]
MKKDTLITYTGRDPEDNYGVVNPPVYHASTITFPSLDEYENRGDNEFDRPQYGRTGTPTQFAFEEAISALHGGFKTVSYPSGLAAIIGAATTFLQQGDHLLMADTVYGPSRIRLANTVLKRAGVKTTFFDPGIGEKISDFILPETKVIFMESPGSLTFEVMDVPAITSVARDKGIITMIDNTWSSPYFCQPIKLGVDVVIEACTKYVVGHSDVMMGSVTLNSSEHYQLVKNMANNYGYHAAPDDCYMALRGLRTISVRLQRHQENAYKVATWLVSRSEIARVMYPALPEDPGHEIWKRDHKGASGLFGVVFTEGNWKAAAALIDGLKHFGLGASWGGFESLVLPAHPEKIRTVNEWPHKTPCLRFHIGLEDPIDLIADLDAGLTRYALACS